MLAAHDTTGNPLTNPAGISDEEISARAYLLWVERGCPQNDPTTDWFTARSQLSSERTLRDAMTCSGVHSERGHVIERSGPPSSRRHAF